MEGWMNDSNFKFNSNSNSNFNFNFNYPCGIANDLYSPLRLVLAHSAGFLADLLQLDARLSINDSINEFISDISLQLGDN